MSNVKVSREYKDRLFHFRFGTEAYKAEVVSVCLTEFDEKVFADGMRGEGKIEEKAESILEFL